MWERIQYWRIATILFFCLSVGPVAFGQEVDGEKWNEAQYLFYEGNYAEASELYEELLEESPKNPGLLLETGICYYRMGTDRQATIDYFQEALDNAPEDEVVPELYFYLAKAHHINYDFDAAIHWFQEFKASIAKNDPLHEDADLFIQMAENGKRMVMDKKEWRITNLGEKINSEYADFRPVLTLDEKVLFFTSRRLWPDEKNRAFVNQANGQYFEDVYYSLNVGGEWQEPVISDISSAKRNEASVAITVDGKQLIIYKDDEEGNGDLFLTELGNKDLKKPEILPEQISDDKSWESHGCFSPDGKTLYFASDRKGGYGGVDLYKVEMDDKGNWGKPENLGSEINTAMDEEAPFMAVDGVTLYFSSNGNMSMGGFDIFYSKMKEDGSWGAKVNMGYPLNTTDDDVFFVLGADGKTGYYASSKQLRKDDRGIMESFGGMDLMKIEFDKSYLESAVFLSGLVLDADSVPIKEGIEIMVVAESQPNDASFAAPRSLDGGYIVLLQPCDAFEVKFYLNDKLIHTHALSTKCADGLQHYYKTIMLNDAGEFISVVPENEGASYWKIMESPEELSSSVIVNLNPGIPASATTLVNENDMFTLPLSPDNSENYRFKFESVNHSVQMATCIAKVKQDGTVIGYAEYTAEGIYIYNGSDPASGCKEPVIAQAEVDTADQETTKTTTTTTTGDRPELKFRRDFTYNKNLVGEQERKFVGFIEQVAAIAKDVDRVDIYIESSASKVPTTTYRTNNNLATLRANNAKKLILSELKKVGVGEDKVRIVNVDIKVSGPEYAGDYQNEAKYAPFQYVIITAK